MRCVPYDTHNDACYSLGMTFLVQFGKSSDFSNPNLAGPLTFLTQIGKFTDLTSYKSRCQERAILTDACPWCVLLYTHIQYKCVLIPYNSMFVGEGTGGRQSLQIDIEEIWTWSIHPHLVGPHEFEDS